MAKEDIPIFNLSEKPLSPKNKEAVLEVAGVAIEEKIEMDKRILRAVSVEANEKIKGIANELVGFHVARCKLYGREVPEKPEIFLIPAEHKKALSEFFETAKKDSTYGFTNNLDNTVVVFTYPNEPDMWVGRYLAHELEHAYSFHQNRIVVTPEAPDGEIQTEIGVYRRGGITISHRGEYGYLLEEGTAELGAIRYFNERLSKLFPADYEAYLEERKHFMEKDGLRDSFKDFVQQSYDEETGTIGIGTTMYTYATSTVQALINEFPNGQELINQAHIRGNYVPLARTFEQYFGKGTFRVFMSLPIDDKSMIGLTELLSATDSEHAKNIIGKLLENRPYDKEKLKRQGML